MDELTVGDITIQCNSSDLVFSDRRKPNFSVTLDNVHIPEILYFLRGISYNPADNRTGFRVPVKSLCKATRSAFNVSIEIAGERIEASAVDMSVTGMRVDNITLDIAIGESIFVNLRHRDNEARVEATVVRFDKSRICLHFPSTLADGELDPPISLMNVYRALESAWLKEHIS
jgi:hypothetical protein